MLTEQQDAEVTFISGLDQSGAIANNTYATYNIEGYAFDPPRAYISKWYNDANASPIASTSKAGTPGGVVTYAFDGTVGAGAQAAYNASMALWSDIANVQFTNVSSTTSAGIRITNVPEDNGDTFVPANGFRVPGTGVTDLPTQMAPNAKGGQASINISANDSNFDNFNVGFSNLMGTVVHETGHALGLGHAGRYNGAREYAGQTGFYDNQSYSVMSYINPDDANAPYYQADKNYQWSTTTNSGSYNGGAQTPMMLDIQAAQRIYGASASKTFSGGQTYGFNNNIVDASKVFYNFSTNSAPIVTLYNTGTNNTLDLSGFRTNSTINLNPGTFSSASASGQLVKNIGIAMGTRIDTAIGGAGDDTIYSNANSNRIDGGGGKNTVVFAGARSNYTVTQIDASNAVVTDKTTGAIDSLTNIQSIQFADPICFTTGTRIAVLRDGRETDVAVEALAIGDVAVTASGALRPIRWIGRRRLVASEHATPARIWPVRVRAGAFGTGRCGRAVPVRDLRLSPGHPVLVGADADNERGVLVPLMCLINGTSIARTPVESVVYWHVELDGHDLLLAEGLPAESFFDCGTRPWFGPVEADAALSDPDFTANDLPGRCRPVATGGPEVEAARARLDRRFADDLNAQSGWPCAGERMTVGR